MTALASLAAALWVLVIGSLADFDTYSRTAFALGIVASAGVFVVADALLRLRRGR
jgi:hypothetical protein